MHLVFGMVFICATVANTSVTPIASCSCVYCWSLAKTVLKIRMPGMLVLALLCTHTSYMAGLALQLSLPNRLTILTTLIKVFGCDSEPVDANKLQSPDRQVRSFSPGLSTYGVHLKFQLHLQKRSCQLKSQPLNIKHSPDVRNLTRNVLDLVLNTQNCSGH